MVQWFKRINIIIDHAYDEHFGYTLHACIHCGAILDCVDARATMNYPWCFEKHVASNVNENLVTRDKTAEMCVAVFENLYASEVSRNLHHKVIWATGVRTIPFTSQFTMNVLDSFNGKVFIQLTNQH